MRDKIKEEEKMEDQEFKFYLEGYQIATRYYDNYKSRIWSRFNIMLTLDSALLALFMTLWFDSKPSTSSRLILFPVFGIIISMLMYAQSAQDRWTIQQYRGQINELKGRLGLGLGLVEEDDEKGEALPMLFSPTEAFKSGKPPFGDGLTAWYFESISIARIPALSSLIFAIVWVVLLVLIMVT